MEAAANIMKFSPTKEITFVGGEPLDQAEALTETCKILKAEGYHIIVITHYLLSEIFNSNHELMENIDILIDGEYDHAQRIWDDTRAGDNVHDVIGSANQMVWDLREWNKDRTQEIPVVAAGELYALALNAEQDLCFIMADNASSAEKEAVA